MSKIQLNDIEDSKRLAKQLATRLRPGMLVYLSGELGAGKTTFTRLLLEALGFSGRVQSPSFAIVLEYSFGEHQVYHFDLYRLSSPIELEELGFRDYLAQGGIILVEWPEKGQGVLPEHADYSLELKLNTSTREAVIKGPGFD